jgi:(p)ppGpp synthase/HD superfamily hydrolase
VVDYAYLIHTEIGNKMIAAKVNGNLVSPIHVLANAEVVEIITYDKLSSKYAFQRHQQWLQHAKTRSARHKIMKVCVTIILNYFPILSNGCSNESFPYPVLKGASCPFCC